MVDKHDNTRARQLQMGQDAPKPKAEKVDKPAAKAAPEAAEKDETDGEQA